MKSKYNLTLDMPVNVREMKLTEVASWLESENRVKPVGKFNTMQMMNILNNIFTRMGLELDNEQFIFLLDDSSRLLCEASAGSGKTTISQLKMIKLKLLYGISGSDILTIAYNEHAAEDMLARHKLLVEQIMSQRISGVKLDNRIVCRTFHSNALAWVIMFADRCGITNKETIVISDSKANALMKKATNSAFKKLLPDVNVNELRASLIPDLLAYLSYIEERMLNVADTINMSKFRELDLNENVVVRIVENFNRLCKHYSSFTFSKIIVMFYELLRDNDEIRDRIQKAYKVLLVDEYQDMSPLMNAVIKLMLNDDMTFNAIGDGDQSIYGFKGTDSLNCIKFKTQFNNGKVVSMGVNRRCRKAIIDVARNIISINKLRYNKDIYSLKDGGSVILKPYDTVVSEYSMIINELKNVPTEELREICIAYRNKESSRLLAKMLLDAKIPFHVKSGYSPYMDMLSTSLYNILMLLRYPTNKAYQLTVLYKVTSASKKQIESVISKVSEDSGLVHYLNYDWSMLGGISRSINNCLSVLHECEESLKSGARMSTFFNKIWNLFSMYYWNWVKEKNNFPSSLEDSILVDYNCELTFKEFTAKYHDMIELRDRFIRTGIGVRLTTFHGLKGLEFNKVYLIDMDDSIFPNYAMIESEFEGDPESELNEKEECARLFYVACTRPRDSLIIFYNEDNPSCYIDLVELGHRRVDSYNENNINREDDESSLDLFSGDVEFEDISDDGEQVVEIKEDDDQIVIQDFEVVIDADSDSSIVVDLTTESNEDDMSNIADHRMYMYHELSDSYFIIEKGEPLYQGSSIDFNDSLEVSKDEYDSGIRAYSNVNGEDIFNSIVDSSGVLKSDSKLKDTIGIMNMLGN